MIFKVAYNPEISSTNKKLIKTEITPSMTSQDGDSDQYPIDMVIELLEQFEDKEKDINYLKELNVDYIEI